MLPVLHQRDRIDLFDSSGERRTQLADLYSRRRDAVDRGDVASEGELNDAILRLVESTMSAYAADLKLRTNEQTKSSSDFVNGMAAAIFSGGVLAPLLGTFVPGNLYASNTLLLGEVSGVCFLAAGVIHLIARGILRSLRA